MKKALPLRSEQGSSLIEIIAAIMIISILSMFFMRMFYQAEQVSSTSDRKLVAANLARQMAERYENVDFSETLNLIPAESKTLTLPDDLTEDLKKKGLPLPDDTQVNGTVFHTKIVLSLVEGELVPYQDRMFKVFVTVYWDDPDNKRTSSSVETYVVKEEIRR